MIKVNELTPEQIETCIAANVTITDWRLRDGVIGAVMDAVALFAKENEMLLGSLPEPVVEAYGWLWHDVSINPRAQKARQLLATAMTQGQMRVGVQIAKEHGAVVCGRVKTTGAWGSEDDKRNAVPSPDDIPRGPGSKP